MANPWTPVWQQNNSIWIIDFRVGNQRIRRRLPIKDKALRALAERMAQEIYKEAWKVELETKKNHKRISFAKAAEIYQKNGGEGRFLPKLVRYFGHDTCIDDIDEILIAKAANDLHPGAKPDTLRRQVRVPVRAIQNFVAGNRRQKSTDVRRRRWLTPEEAERLLATASDPRSVGLRDPNLETLRKIGFMLGTGAGPGETMSLDGCSWNPSTRQWWLAGTKTVYRPRFVVLPQRAVDIIGVVPEAGAAFPAPNGQPYRIHPNRGAQMAVAFRKVRDGAGLGPDVVPYTLRHTWATWFYAQTKDWAALLDQGGWGRSDTANRYRKVAPADLGNRLLAHGWDFRPEDGAPVRFGELVSVNFKKTSGQ